MLTLWDKTRIAAHYAQGALNWLRHDSSYPSPFPDNPRFCHAAAAAALIPDRATLAVSGLGGHQRASILYWAIRERFERFGHPARLTVINVGGHGGRGVAPGTLEELGQPGLCTRFITGHFETFHAMLDLAEAGQCELQCLPLGLMTLLFERLGRGVDSMRSRTGVGTFLDPRVGRGTAVTGRRQLVTVERGQLRYRMPAIDVALFNVPAADRHGNLYARHAATIGESYELARAARRNGGLVIANVGRLVDPGYDRVFLPARAVDAIVYHPDTEQTLGILHRDPWLELTPEGKGDIDDSIERVHFVNSAAGRLTGALRRRSSADAALMRVAAATLLSNVPRGALVTIGTGLPEEIPAVVHAAGARRQVQFAVESGVVGGVPAAGLFFGASLQPDEIISSAALFRRCYQKLDATCLGVLEADGEGNVNVSKRDHGLRDYVGPGGFMDFASAANCIVFISAWMRGGQIDLVDGAVRIRKFGKPKFVAKVGEITFNGRLAQRAGKRVLFVTHVGIFERTQRGMQLVRVMPGIDIQRDIVDFSPMPILLPPSGRVKQVPAAVIDGHHLRLRLPTPS